MSILEVIENYQKELGDSKTKVQNIRSTISAMKPEIVRAGYDSFLEKVDTKKDDIDGATQRTKKEITLLKDCQKLLNEINIEIDKTVQVLSSKKTGTLEGITRGFVGKNLTEFGELSEHQKRVIAQLYDEQATIDALKQDGGKRYNKRNKKSKKRNTKSKKRNTKKSQ